MDSTDSLLTCTENKMDLVYKQDDSACGILHFFENSFHSFLKFSLILCPRNQEAHIQCDHADLQQITARKKQCIVGERIIQVTARKMECTREAHADLLFQNIAAGLSSVVHHLRNMIILARTEQSGIPSFVQSSVEHLDIPELVTTWRSGSE